MITISRKSAVSSKTGNPYTYISIFTENAEIDRIFIKQTENSFFDSLIGSYEKIED